MKNLTTDEVLQLKDLPDYALIDVRPLSVYEGYFPAHPELAGHIPGALSFPLGDMTDAETVAERLDDLGLEGKKLILYCNSGVTSVKAATALKACGVAEDRLLNYPGSMEEWTSKGLDLVR